uniref:Clathrin/coatomer adaptor adaptin-like N-terminal domain-containing protein n=1 Tax=Amphora coffeiformis TaxID=265554 RepID=A0A7S3L733_9STRA|eukprot:scaffold448_cov156-Amphora_coffeaeformis.AAC.6
MFEKTLTDIVKGIRASKRDTALYISQCIAEIKTEIHSKDMYVKANALQKLTFLHMMGYSMNWASFATIEVMSSTRFAHKRVGYLAASQGFTQHTEVILLTTNLLKKELRGAVGGGMKGVYEAGLAINCIANIVTEDLATDLLPELTNLTQHPQPYLRKKAILCLYKVFIKYPQGLRLTFARLQQCLEDTNPAVVSCAVNVITELSDKNPRNYLQLAPAFFQLLTESSNNWMLIKVVKLLGSLVPEEPRLARKLLEPLAKIVQQTQAKSLLYEAVHTITLCLPYCRKSDGSMPAIVPEIVTLSAQTLRTFVEEPDQNLKYLGLVGFGSLMKSHPRVLSASEYRPLVLACLSDQDVTIRTRALDLLVGLVTRKNLSELVTQLLEHVKHATGTYRHDLVAQIINICRQDKYSLVQDFAWYTDVLFRLGHMQGLQVHADLLRAQITDVALRVLPVRAHAVEQSMRVLLAENKENSYATEEEDITLLGDNGRGKNIMPGVLPAAAWTVGEYSDLIAKVLQNDFELEDNAFLGVYHALIHTLTLPWHTQRLPTTTQTVFVQAALKVLAAASAAKATSKAELEAAVSTLYTNLPLYTQSTDVEVVERAFTGLELLRSMGLESGVPGLTAADSDEEDELTADLLGLDGSKPAAPKSSTSSSFKSLASKVKEASPVLNHLLKPTPMKPIGAKAQRKKLTSPLGHNVDLDAPAELSIFSDLIDQELSQRTTVSSLESVSFTQQQPRRVEEKKPVSMMSDNSMVMTGFGSNDTSRGSFQNPTVSTHIGSTARQKQGDPFYLDSTPTNAGETELENKLSTIQLGDSDDEGPKKHKKAKKKKVSKRDDLSFVDSTTLEMSNTMVAAPTIYDSADEEDDSESAIQKKKSKEYDHLARIDLTTPLREDEVMPERKHRTADPMAVTAQAPDVRPKKEKKHKHKKKSKKKETEEPLVPSSLMDVDLLDLGGFGGTPTPAPVASAPTSMSNTGTSISDAFGDLLTLSMPTPSIQSPSAPVGSVFGPSKVPSTSTSGAKPWLKASLKLSKQSGGDINWSMVQLLYRINRNSTVNFRLNNLTSSSLHAVRLELKNGQSIDLGSTPPGGSADSQRIEQIPAPPADESLELKGTLSSNNSSVPFKITVPAAFHLTPESGMSIDRVAEELSTGNWSSASAKIERHAGLSSAQISEAAVELFNAAPVLNSSTDSSAAFAARSRSSGAQVRIFLKLKSDAVKLEIRCSSVALGAALASDAKRMVV